MKGSIMFAAGLILGFVMSRFTDMHIAIEFGIALAIGLCIWGVNKVILSKKQNKTQ
jgi:hypothetical protein